MDSKDKKSTPSPVALSQPPTVPPTPAPNLYPEQYEEDTWEDVDLYSVLGGVLTYTS